VARERGGTPVVALYRVNAGGVPGDSGLVDEEGGGRGGSGFRQAP
jgi:hypothetical protein